MAEAFKKKHDFRLPTGFPSPAEYKVQSITNPDDTRPNEGDPIDEFNQCVQELKDARILKAPECPLIIVAAGDSWFDYPKSAASGDPIDLIGQLHSNVSPEPVSINFAKFGWTTSQSLSQTGLHWIEARLSDSLTGPAIDAILYSGGGDDIAGGTSAGDGMHLAQYLNEASDVHYDVNGALNDGFGDMLRQALFNYNALADIRDHRYPANPIPIFIHGYDYAYPSGSAASSGLAGPWLRPSLIAKGWMTSTDDPADCKGTAIVRLLLDRFRAMLLQFKTNRKKIHLVDMLGTLEQNQVDWANELHPTEKGFKELFREKFFTEIREAFPTRKLALL